MRLILPMPGNEAFGAGLAAAAGAELGQVKVHTYPGGESAVQILGPVDRREVFIVCTLARPNPEFLPLIFAADACRELGARRLTLVAPYLAYMRYDAHFLPGDAITSRTFARLVSSSFDRLITVDPHLHRYRTLSEIYSIPAQALSASAAIGEWVRSNIANPLIVGPDSESEQWASRIGVAAGAPHVALAKQRLGDVDVRITAPDLSRFSGRRPVLIDDIASSGRTLAAAAGVLRDHGFEPPVCVVVHGIFAGEAFEKLAAVTGGVVSTDSVAHASNRIGLAPLIAAALTD